MRYKPEAGSGPAILTPAEHEELVALIHSTPGRKESALVRFITPYLWRLRVQSRLSADDRCPPVLVNSENYKWLNPYGRVLDPDNRLKPDLFCSWEAFIERKFPEGAPSGAEYVFGVVSNHRLQADGVVREFYEAKCASLGNDHLGQLHQYHTCIRGACRGMLFSHNEFWLYQSFDEFPVRLFQAQWTQPGTADLVQLFFTEGVEEPKLVQQLRWALNGTDAILAPVPKPFLGGGGFGRVFHVQVGGMDRALKLAQKDVKRLHDEYDYLVRLQTLGAPVVAPVAESYKQLADHAGCFLLEQVGTPFQVTSVGKCEKAFQALNAIHMLDFVHGDPRLPNLLELGGRPVWIDVVQTMSVQDFKLGYVREDMAKLTDSIIDSLTEDVVAALSAYVPDEPLTLNSLVNAVWAAVQNPQHADTPGVPLGLSEIQLLVRSTGGLTLGK